jgi:hypothetical protein
MCAFAMAVMTVWSRACPRGVGTEDRVYVARTAVDVPKFVGWTSRSCRGKKNKRVDFSMSRRTPPDEARAVFLAWRRSEKVFCEIVGRERLPACPDFVALVLPECDRNPSIMADLRAGASDWQTKLLSLPTFSMASMHGARGAGGDPE